MRNPNRMKSRHTRRRPMLNTLMVPIRFIYFPNTGEKKSIASEWMPTTGLYSDAVAPLDEASVGKNGVKHVKVKPKQNIRHDRDDIARYSLVFILCLRDQKIY